MLKVSQLYNKPVFAPSKKREKKGGEVAYAKLGKVHMTVFSPDGQRVVGFLVKRPDIVGMVKRPDVFLAFDSFATYDKGIRATRGEQSFDDAARERMGLAWDSCVMWAGMDAKTTDGRELGYVGDVSFDAATGKVQTFYVGDGGMAQQLVGSVEIPASMLCGYRKGFMLVAPEAAHLDLNGGFAAKAGEATAKAKADAAKAGEKIGKGAGEAVDRGSFELGRMIGRTRRAFQEAKEDYEDEMGTGEVKRQPAPSPAQGVSVHKPPAAPALKGETSARTPVTYAPAKKAPKAPAKKPATKKAPSKKAGPDPAKALGHQLGALGKGFSSFAEEYKKASK